MRVYLYQCDGRIFFGEMTFHPGGGFEPFSPASWDLKLGDYLWLPLAIPRKNAM
ncbi:ATP-grasp fold amidoligase family protein [Candidatus Thiosymbion oneisti]|uniref:ATP-grasp fold amidoligase family protein n=1 Tax=Candidatus Thiosymbion oneisti TaxID=589554 RepID=UPI000B7DD4A7